MKKSLSLIVFCSMLAACGGGGGGGHHGGGAFIPSSPDAPGKTPTPAPTQSPTAQSGTIYVGSRSSGKFTIAAFDSNGNPKPVSGTFSALQTWPAVKYDSSNGLLYTPNLVSNSVYTVASFNQQGQPQTLAGAWSGLTNPGDDIVYDSHNGFIYVPNYSHGAWTMLAYDSNGNVQSQPAGAWTGLNKPYAIAFDRNNNEFYISSKSGVQVWNENGNAVTPAAGFANLPTANQVTVQGLTYDSHNGMIYVAESNSTILTYDESGNLKSQGVWQGVFLPGRMAFDPDNNEIYMIQVTGPFKVTWYDENGNQKTQAGSFPGVAEPNSIEVVP